MNWIRNGPESLGAQNITEAIDNRFSLFICIPLLLLNLADECLSSAIFVISIDFYPSSARSTSALHDYTFAFGDSMSKACVLGSNS